MIDRQYLLMFATKNRQNNCIAMTTCFGKVCCLWLMTCSAVHCFMNVRRYQGLYSILGAENLKIEATSPGTIYFHQALEEKPTGECLQINTKDFYIYCQSKDIQLKIHTFLTSLLGISISLTRKLFSHSLLACSKTLRLHFKT